jgi:phospholipid transport system substrate-binding protein
MTRRAPLLLAVAVAVSFGMSLGSPRDSAGSDEGSPRDGAGSDETPLALTRRILTRSNEIVRSNADKKTKLTELSTLLKDFLDTDALADRAAHKHLVGKSDAEKAEFRQLFHDFFVRTYTQRLLLFDAPDFAYGAETITGDDAKVGTEVVTKNDRFAVDYNLHQGPTGWRANDILVEGVSLAQNFRAQFDAAVAKDSFQGLLERLRAKVGAPA